MLILTAILAATLTRAEIIERIRATPLVKVSGLVQVEANCPADMRREFQSPIARFAADVCTRMCNGTNTHNVEWKQPLIVVSVGDERTNRTDVIVRERRWLDGTEYTRIMLPAPAFADVDRFRLELARAFMHRVKGVRLDDVGAEEALLAADPELGALAKYRELNHWLNGDKVTKDDEHYIKMTRTVMHPGVAMPEDITRFASRLYFYPQYYAFPFAGRVRCCSLREAITLVNRDLRIRLAALALSSDVVAYGGGRGEKLDEAAMAYSEFLRALAANKSSAEELEAMLDAADAKLELAMEEARQRAEGTLK